MRTSFDPVYSDAKARAQTLGEFNFFSAWMSQPKSQLETFRAWAGKDSDIRFVGSTGNPIAILRAKYLSYKVITFHLITSTSAVGSFKTSLFQLVWLPAPPRVSPLLNLTTAYRRPRTPLPFSWTGSRSRVLCTKEPESILPAGRRHSRPVYILGSIGIIWRKRSVTHKRHAPYPEFTFAVLLTPFVQSGRYQHRSGAQRLRRHR